MGSVKPPPFLYRRFKLILLDVISELDENKNCFVFHNDRLVTYYDGKNSIDKSYNDRTIKSVSFVNNAYIIKI